ncbi:hypothetical protein CEXT_732061 [Caerostris extrusa]|uniref:Uncharacterized protein n=1 Tax=Caerostris extrusa TaxID=172846 RepID=A0AAV4T4D2_CAEEX|nr:hypothetical protein CEXT_732061 [Caerostris extrusa]
MKKIFKSFAHCENQKKKDAKRRDRGDLVKSGERVNDVLWPEHRIKKFTGRMLIGRNKSGKNEWSNEIKVGLREKVNGLKKIKPVYDLVQAFL